MSSLGVSAWLLAWTGSSDVAPSWAGASAAAADVTEAEAAFVAPFDLVVPDELPVEDASPDRFAMLEWALGYEHHACAYESNGTVYERVTCDVALPADRRVLQDYVAVWSDVEDHGQRPGGRIFIDFTGGGILLRCAGVTHFLGDVNIDQVDVSLHCAANSAP
jgi:hypothetical protein